jgi:glycosyltransferase involved in cell wall biosynthesis
LDATYSIGESLSGVGLYSREILFGLASAHPEVSFRFCYRPHRYFRSWRERLPANVRRSLLAESLGLADADLFHGLNQRLPSTVLRCAVATFHDLFMMTSEYSTPDFRARFTEQARDAASRVAAVITVSEFTRQQVIACLGVAPNRVHVVHHGTRNLPRLESKPEKVILSVGAVQKRKNIARLVEAFETVGADWRLVLAGSAGYGAEQILARIALSPATDRISVVGYVSPEDLAAWYARSAIFAFPSLDEGFGMPILEAMAADVPVLTSNRSALPEVAGDAALLVDPESVDSIARGLRDLTQNEDLRRDLAGRGKLRAQEFTWEKAVRATWDVYRQVLG